MRVDPAGNREQAVGGELLRARHRAAELGDPAAGYADVSGFPVTGRDHGRAAYNEVKAHRSIVARGYQTAARVYLPGGCICQAGVSARRVRCSVLVQGEPSRPLEPAAPQIRQEAHPYDELQRRRDHEPVRQRGRRPWRPKLKRGIRKCSR